MTGEGIVGEYLSLREEADADLLAMQVGDFYEFFAGDAETVAEELDLKVSEKSSHGSSYPMAGVPVDDLTPYLRALVERGYRVAVADQYETDGGHARRVDRVVTPGTLLETTDADARYLATVCRDDGRYGLAFLDITTGRFHVATAADADAACSELSRVAPVEILPGPEARTEDALLDRLRERTDARLTLHAAEDFAPGRARHRVRDQFGAETLESVGIADSDAAVRAAGAALAYVEGTGAGVLASITRLRRHEEGVALDATTRRNLELVETMHGEGEGTLLDTVDHTVTSAGGRLLAEWLQRPRRDRGTLEARQAAVAALTEAAMARDRLREALSGAYDLERLASTAASGSADARDLRAAADTLGLVEDIAALVGEVDRLADSPLADVLDRPDRAGAAELAATLEEALVADPPGTVTQGGLIARGYDADLDEVIERHEEAKAWIEDLPEREKARTGITHLTVDRNATDGYYIQVGNSETDAVPDAYERIKSLKNAERYTTPELDEREREILRLEERRGELEYDLFAELRDRVAERAALLQTVGRALAEVDALAALATHAVRNDWTRPDLCEDGRLAVEAGRHPVVEQTTDFVPNDLHMDADRRFLIVTGPNMSGKSTYMRQAALIVLLAQVGSFVPARHAEVGLVDGIYTRVGALDELAGGRSTFMVEMAELANILHSATGESLVILDEVGRGTATYDGISIAWAATEYLHNTVRAKTLFATHYHELTTLGEELPGVENVHVAVDGEPSSPSASGTSSRPVDGEPDGASGDRDVTFLRTVREGPTDRSYGVHVADLAGVPEPVVDRSREVLDRLREEKAVDVRGGGGEPVQAVFDLNSGSYRGEAAPDGSGDGVEERFGGDAGEVLAALADLEVGETPPVELMATVQEWQERLETD